MNQKHWMGQFVDQQEGKYMGSPLENVASFACLNYDIKRV